MKDINKSDTICVLAPRLARLTPPAGQCASACFGGPLSPHRAVARGPSGSRATCVYVSWPVGLYNSGNASRGLLAGHGAGIMNHSPWVGHCREVLGRALVAAALAP